MKLIARKRIYGAKNDAELYVLNGIGYYEADVDSPDELMDLFEKDNPDFYYDWCEIDCE